jgi:hypothetical protein
MYYKVDISVSRKVSKFKISDISHEEILTNFGSVEFNDGLNDIL